MIECTPTELTQMLTTRVEVLRKAVMNTLHAKADPEEYQKLVRERAGDCTLVLQEITKQVG